MLRAIRSSENQADVHQIPLNFVYMNPSIQRLGEYFWRVLTGTHDVDGQNHAAHVETRCLEMESLVTKYTAGIPSPTWKTLPEPPLKETILLTGSTGRLGSHILKQLAEKVDTAKIYALNRPSALGLSSEVRQKGALESWGISVNQDAWEKIVFVEYDPSRDRLSLTEDVYGTVRFFLTKCLTLLT
jgi:hypothetical protein